MPNWVKNIVRTSDETMKKIKEKYFTEGILDFDKIIPMPKSLQLTSGSITDMAIFYAIIKKSPKEQLEIAKILENNKNSIHNSIHKNYLNRINHYYNSENFKNIEEIAKKYIPEDIARELNITTFEELGDAYINNIKKYGSDTWYDWCFENWGTKWNCSKCISNNNTIIFETAWSTPEPIFEKISKDFPEDIIEIDYADECYSNDNNGKLFFKGGKCIEALELDEDFAAEVWDEYIEDSKLDIDITDELFD